MVKFLIIPLDKLLDRYVNPSSATIKKKGIRNIHDLSGAIVDLIIKIINCD